MGEGSPPGGRPYTTFRDATGMAFALSRRMERVEALISMGNRQEGAGSRSNQIL